MRYHYEEPDIYLAMYGKVHICDRSVYSRCTLYLIGIKGLAVVQQRYDKETKHVWWEEIDAWLVDDLYLHPKFKRVFDKYAGECVDGLYPTITVRQIMWDMRMKPIKREPWEIYFDRKDI